MLSLKAFSGKLIFFLDDNDQSNNGVIDGCKNCFS
jgi:hypothetical protein